MYIEKRKIVTRSVTDDHGSVYLDIELIDGLYVPSIIENLQRLLKQVPEGRWRSTTLDINHDDRDFTISYTCFETDDECNTRIAKELEREKVVAEESTISWKKFQVQDLMLKLNITKEEL